MHFRPPKQFRVIGAFCLAGALLTGCGKPSTPEAWRTEAQAQLDKRDIFGAVVSYKNALQLNPNDAESRFRLGKLYAQTGDGAPAESELNKARQLDFPEAQIVEPMLRAHLANRKFELAVKEAAAALQDAALAKARSSSRPGPLSADLLALKGTAHLELGQRDEARATFDAALREMPDHSIALIGLARFAAIDGKPSVGKELLTRIKSPDPDDVMYWRVLGSLERQSGDLKAAADAYGKAADAIGGTVQDLESHALLSLSLGRREDAEKDAERLSRRAPNAAEGSYVRGMLLFRERAFGKAKDAFRDALSKNDLHAQSKFYLGATELALGHLEQAEQHLGDFLAQVPGNTAAIRIVATLMLKRGDASAAVKLLEPFVLGDLPDDALVTLLTNAYLTVGRSADAMQLLERQAALQPDSVPARLRLGFNQLSVDQEKALETLKSVVNLEPENKAGNALLAATQLRLGKLDDAEQTVNAFVQGTPNDPLAYTLLGKVLLAKKDEAKAVEAFHKVRELAPGDPAANLILAVRASSQGEEAEAARLFDEILKYHPDELQTLLVMAGERINVSDKTGAAALLERAIKAHPESVEPRVLMATLKLDDGDAKGAVALFPDEMRAANQTHAAMWFVAGQAFLEVGDLGQAKQSFMMLNTLQPKSVRANFYLAKTYNLLGEFDNMEAALRTVLEVKPDYLEAQINLARLLLTRGQIAEAQQAYNAASKLAPNDPAVATIGAALAASSGDLKTAAATYREAHLAHPTTTTLLGLSRARWMLGDRGSVTKDLEGWLTNNPDDEAVMVELSQVYVALDNREKAIPLLEKLIEKQPKTSSHLNNLAWLYRERAPERALEYAGRAHSLAPKSIEVLDTISVIQLDLGKLQLATDANASALRERPDDPRLRFRRVQILAKRGMTADAREQLSQLLQQHQEFPERREAEALAKTL